MVVHELLVLCSDLAAMFVQNEEFNLETSFLSPLGITWREEESSTHQHPQEGATKAKEPDVK